MLRRSAKRLKRYPRKKRGLLIHHWLRSVLRIWAFSAPPPLDSLTYVGNIRISNSVRLTTIVLPYLGF